MAEVLRRLRRVPIRVLHALRRQRALRALRRRPGLTSLLVVCYGNLCRSPFTAALLRLLCSRSWVHVDSAGFAGPGRRPPPAAVTAARRYGVDLSAHRSQRLSADSARAADLIVVMDPAQGRAIRDCFGRAGRDVLILGDLDPQRADTRAVRDPMNQRPVVFEETYARIERCTRELARAIVQITG